MTTFTGQRGAKVITLDAVEGKLQTMLTIQTLLCSIGIALATSGDLCVDPKDDDYINGFYKHVFYTTSWVGTCFSGVAFPIVLALYMNLTFQGIHPDDYFRVQIWNEQFKSLLFAMDLSTFLSYFGVTFGALVAFQLSACSSKDMFNMVRSVGIVSQMVVIPTLLWIAVLTYHGNKSHETTQQEINISDIWASMEVSLRDQCRSKVEEARLSGSQLLLLTRDDFVSVLNIPLGDAMNLEDSLLNYISHLHSTNNPSRKLGKKLSLRYSRKESPVAPTPTGVRDDRA